MAAPVRGLAAAAAAAAVAAALALALPAPAAAQPPGSPASWVDPTIGSEGFGHTYPGATLPFGFASPGPDTTDPTTSGYNPHGLVTGFSQTRVSGTAGGSKYGNFRLTPISGPPRASDLASPFEQERASPGQYSVLLTRHGIRASMTATRMCALHRYRFAPGAEQHAILDATSTIEVPYGQHPLGARVRLRGRRSVEGWASFAGGWSLGRYKLHFALRFSRPRAAGGIFHGDRLGRRRALTAGANERAGAWASFDPAGGREVAARICVSFMGTARARRRLARELGSASPRRVRGRARAEWQRTLATIAVRGGTPEQRTAFYSALYRSHLMPHDLTGENVWWGAKRGPQRPHYEDFYTLWDTFRTLHPLLTLIQPRRQSEMVESLVDVYRHTGWLPDARVAGNNGITQGGTSGDVVVADALVKGLPGIDYATAYRALRKNAEVSSPKPLRQGRELGHYRELGYMSTAYGRSGSRTVEYAYDDFAVAQMARALGRAADERRYRLRARNWRNLWDPGLRSIRPRNPDGSWMAPFDPEHIYPDGRFRYLDAPFYEGSGRQYSTFVPHDVRGLIERLGGDGPFVDWLDELFDRGLHDPGNEPGLLAPYLYVHAGRPDRTADRVRWLLEHSYSADRDGLPGNDDAGALSSWYVWGAIGIYPNAGQPLYYIGSPLFERSEIALGDGGRSFVMEAAGTDDKRRYVQSARLNGAPLRRAWLWHDELAAGGRLELVMGPEPSSWGTGQDERPPSL